MMWTKAERKLLDNRNYEFSDDPYKYRKKPREVMTIDEIYAEYPRLRDKLEGKGKGKEGKRKTRKTRKTRRKSKGDVG